MAYILSINHLLLSGYWHIVQIQTLAWQLPDAMGADIKKKKSRHSGWLFILV